MISWSHLIGAVAAMTSLCAMPLAGQAPISITISADSAIVKSGSNPSIKIEMTNISDHEVDCTKVYTDSGVDVRFHYDIKDVTTGKAVGKRLRKHPEIGEGGSFYSCSLPSGQSTGTHESHIGALFDMTKPGKYSVQVWRLVKGGLIVRSNSIEITVTP